MKNIIIKILKVIWVIIAIIILVCLAIYFYFELPLIGSIGFNRESLLYETYLPNSLVPYISIVVLIIVALIISLIVVFIFWTFKKVFSKLKFVEANKKVFKVIYNIPKFLAVGILLFHIAVLINTKLCIGLTEEEKMFKEINNKCADLPDTEFVDALSDYDLSKLSEFHQSLVNVMRDYNLAIEPLKYGHYKEVIKRLYDMHDNYKSENVKNYININIDYDIRKHEYMFIKNTMLPTKMSHVNSTSRAVHFGRTANGKPLEFSPILYEDGKYLLLQTNYLQLPFNYRDLYNENGENKILENELISKFFEVEKPMIKEAFIFSEEDFKKYFPDEKERNLYKCSPYNKDFNDSKSDNKIRSYWVRNDDLNVPTKYVNNGNLKEVKGEAENNMLAGLRLAIWVEYPYESFR